MEVVVTPARQLSKAERAHVATIVKHRYAAGAPIRAIAGDLSVSYGFIHRLLTEADVQFRPRGSAPRRKTTAHDPQSPDPEGT